MMETTQNKWKKKHQQPPSVMQLSTAGAALSKSRTQSNNDDDRNSIEKKKKKNSSCGSSGQELKLAAIAISLNVRLRTSDMPVSMQEHALRYTRSLLGDAAPPHHRLSPTVLARSIKKEFDGVYGPAWHCVVGKSFGSFVTHSAGGFVYFSLDSLSFLLFKTAVQLVKDSE